MNTLILLVDRDSVWSPEGWAEEVGGKRVSSAQITVERAGNYWLSVVRDNDVLDDFDETERARLDESVTDPVAYLVEWSGDELVELVLRS